MDLAAGSRHFFYLYRGALTRANPRFVEEHDSRPRFCWPLKFVMKPSSFGVALRAIGEPGLAPIGSEQGAASENRSWLKLGKLARLPTGSRRASPRAG